jgi:hypothetical protein
MDWFKVLGSSADTTADLTTLIATRTQLTPSIAATYSFKPKGLDPWLSSIDITRLTAYATLLSKTSTPESLNEDSTLFNYDPNRTFFYPSTFRPIDLALSFKGTLFSSSPSILPSATPSTDTGTGKAKDEGRPELRSPWSDSESGNSAGGETGEAAAGSPAASGASADAGQAEDFRLPPRAPSVVAGKTSDWSGNLGWTMTPSAYYEDSYLNTNWNGPADIDYARLYSLFSYRVAATLDGSLSYGDFLSSSLGLSYADQAQQRPYLYDDGTPESTAPTYRLADDNFKSRLVGENAKVTLKPLASSWLWSASSLSWDMTSTIYGYKFDSASSTFTESWISWDPATITSHDLSLTLAARPGNLTQSLSLTAALPPVLESYAGKLSLDAGIATFNTQSRVYRAVSGGDFIFDSITSGVSIGVAPLPVLTDNFVYDTMDSRPDSNVAGLTWGPLSASLTSMQTSSYTPTSSGWVAVGNESFGLSGLTIGLSPQLKGDASATGGPSWSLGAGLALSQSLVRFTESSLDFNLNVSFKVGDKFSFTFSSQSENSAAWRYYPWLFSGELAEIGKSSSSYAMNPLTDVWNGLSVWDSDKLRLSLFKLKSLSLKAAQDLHDWTLSAEITTAPLYDATLQQYSLDTSISILLAWKDIPDIKTTVTSTTATGLTY